MKQKPQEVLNQEVLNKYLCWQIILANNQNKSENKVIFSNSHSCSGCSSCSTGPCGSSRTNNTFYKININANQNYCSTCSCNGCGGCGDNN